MAGNRSQQYYIDYRCVVRFLHCEIVVVAGTSAFHFGVLGRFSDSHKENCHRCNAVHLYLVLTAGLDRFFTLQIVTLLISVVSFGGFASIIF